jgi:hypothetical protein
MGVGLSKPCAVSEAINVGRSPNMEKSVKSYPFAPYVTGAMPPDIPGTGLGVHDICTAPHA